MVSRGTRSWDGSNAITIDQLNSLKSGNDTKMSHVEGARNFRRVFCGEQHNGELKKASMFQCSTLVIPDV